MASRGFVTASDIQLAIKAKAVYFTVK